MTVVGVVSDTHLPRFGTALPAALLDGLRAAGVTRVLHCGDFTQPLAVPLFAAIAPLEAVAGNNDPEDIRRWFGERKIVRIERARIGLVHGHAGRRAAHENALAAFAGERLEAILYGHSHRPRVERLPDGTLVGNPGSPTDKRTNPTFSYGIMTVDGRDVALELHHYDSRAIAPPGD
jgi:putative phosphoesterase